VDHQIGICRHNDFITCHNNDRRNRCRQAVNIHCFVCFMSFQHIINSITGKYITAITIYIDIQLTDIFTFFQQCGYVRWAFIIISPPFIPIISDYIAVKINIG